MELPRIGLETKLNPLQLARYKQIKENFKLSPATIAHKLDSTWIPTRYLLKLSSLIASELVKGDARLLISVPPRHGKSKLATEYGITWFLENFPHLLTVIATYGADLSTDFSRKIRDHFLTRPELSTKIRSDAANVNQWETTKGGGCRAVGIGGALTGKGADLLIIDDYLKDIAEASNPRNLEAIYDWFKTVAYTRLHPGGSVIIIATRWDVDDLIGRLQQDDSDGKWKTITFPAIAEEDDILGRTPGEALFPGRYDIAKLEDIRKTLGSHFFASLYQQRPIAKDQMKVEREWFKIVNEIPNAHKFSRARAWDLAATEGAGDYTAGPLCLLDRNTENFYIIDMVRAQRGSAAVEEMVRKTALDDGLQTPIYIEQEPGSSGKSLFEIYKDRILKEFTVKATLPSGQKTVRAQPFLAAAEAGKVFLLRGEWNEAFIAEAIRFPRGKNDDQIDATSQAFNALTLTKLKSATWGRK